MSPVYSVKDVPGTFTLKRLESKGLLTEPMGMIIDYEGGQYYVTDYFRRMMSFLNLNRLLFVPAEEAPTDSNL